jgi:Ca2+-binding RTX toxin-like protein
MDLLADSAFGGTILQQDATTYQREADGVTYTFSGTGLTYNTAFGPTLLSGGTVSSISVSQGATQLGTLSNLAMPAADLTAAFLNDALSVDPFALEALFLTQDWVFNGNNNAQILTADQFTADGYSYLPSGSDTAYLYDGDNVFDLGLGNDTLFGGDGNDQLYGSDGNDLIYGGNDKDQLYGGNGEDSLFGGMSGGTDLMYGGADNDQLSGGNQRDKLWGAGESHER